MAGVSHQNGPSSTSKSSRNVQRRWQGAALMSRTAFMRRRMLLTCNMAEQIWGVLLCPAACKR